jgi:hypothetical protein
LFFVLTIEWITLAVDNCILCNNPILRRINLDDFEFHGPHTTTNGEQITLSKRSIRFEEVWFKINIKERASETFDCVCYGKDGDTFCVLDVGTGMDGDNVSKSNTDICADNTVDSGHSIIKLVVGKDNEDSVFSLFTLDEDGIASAETECFHRVYITC